MKHVIIGTAGHVDHGKTLLIKALTGIDTDRLQEEKKRGITIELGFAHLDWEDGLQAGVVDVPGHEKFIKNMLAGAGGIDLAMLIVAADEGFMPQTLEHLDILSLLGLETGVIVLTKIDTVEADWVEMMEEEIRQKVKGTFLEESPIIPVSAYNGQGIPELSALLHDLVAAAASKNMRVPFRLPVDRVFSVDGFGTVVTGTLIEGCVSEGDEAMVFPSGTETRIRNLQVHSNTVPTAFAGQRVAINLAGLKKSDLQRGDVIGVPDSVRSSLMLDVRLQSLASSGRVIKNNMQVHLYHGATVTLAKVILLDRDQLSAGEHCFAQLRMGEPLSSKNGDRFVIRFFSPLETIGGGVILDDSPPVHKRNVPEVIEMLTIKEQGSTGDRVLQCVAEFGQVFPTFAQILSKLGDNEADLTTELADLSARGQILELISGRYVAASVVDRSWQDCKVILDAYHQKNPLHGGMRLSELRQKLFKTLEQACGDALIAELCREGFLRGQGGFYARYDFSVKLTKRQTGIREKLLDYYEKAGIEPETVEEVLGRYPQKELTDCKQVLESLVTSGELVMLAPQLCYGKDTFAHVRQVILTHFQTQETITLAELRDALGTSRKYALSILEYLDKNRITKKEEDARRLVGAL